MRRAGHSPWGVSLKHFPVGLSVNFRPRDFVEEHLRNPQFQSKQFFCRICCPALCETSLVPSEELFLAYFLSQVCGQIYIVVSLQRHRIKSITKCLKDYAHVPEKLLHSFARLKKVF